MNPNRINVKKGKRNAFKFIFWNKRTKGEGKNIELLKWKRKAFERDEKWGKRSVMVEEVKKERKKFVDWINAFSFWGLFQIERIGKVVRENILWFRRWKSGFSLGTWEQRKIERMK